MDFVAMIIDLSRQNFQHNLVTKQANVLGQLRHMNQMLKLVLIV